MTQRSSAESEECNCDHGRYYTKLIQVLIVNHKEQMEEQDRRHQEQMNEQDRRHREQMAEQARQSR